MTKPADRWCSQFHRACNSWQVRLGLSDWTLRHDDQDGDGSAMARVLIDVESRNAEVIAYRTAVKSGQSPDRIALHEMLHLLLADLNSVTSNRGGDHEDSQREEHRVIHRLLNAFQP